MGKRCPTHTIKKDYGLTNENIKKFYAIHGHTLNNCKLFERTVGI